MGHSNRIQKKIFNKRILTEKIIEWKEKGLKVVFTNGCFDILHAGHVDYLNKAADLGDRLIVAINSDDSVRRLKGACRPIQDEYSRTTVLASLECVSGVIVFDEPTPIDLISTFKPSILVKGGDYAHGNIVGKEVVLENNGEVIVIPLVKGYSTTAIELKIRQAT